MINPMHEGFVEPTKKYAKLLFKDDVQYDLLFQELELLSDEIINKNKKQ